MRSIINTPFRALFSVLLVSLLSCSEEFLLPDNQVNFESNQLGFASDETSVSVRIAFTRSAEQDGIFVINLAPNGVTYGTDFVTQPAASGNTLTLPFAKDATEVTYTIDRIADALLDGDESVVFSMIDIPNQFVPGTILEQTVNFSEILAKQATLDINGGGPTYPNKVFIDLSANRQTAVNRTTWDLGFSNGEAFNVILNSSVTMMARAIDKTDMNAVTAADTVGFANEMIMGAFSTNPAMAWIDDPAGDLSKTAIASISATASENKVYIINRGASNPPNDPSEPTPSRGWKKIRIIRNANGYTLQHADIAATTFQEIQIAKEEGYNFRYVNFESGTTTVEPVKGRWDIAWTGFTNSTSLGGDPIPYYFQDVILTNRNGVQTAQLLIATYGTYENFTAANLTGITFSSSQIGIGSGWRSGGGPGSAPAVRTDRFYLVKDADGNIYKLRFTALTQNGERGKPQIEFQLL